MSDSVLKAKLYLDAEGLVRWQLTAANGEIVGASTQGYKDRRDAIKNWALVTSANRRVTHLDESALQPEPENGDA